jgi:S-DNA-T family DNA segregation ATPase FtsK/SpoIIIE
MVLNLWVAVQEACDWLAELWWNITAQGKNSVDQGDYFRAERQVICEVHRPGWREPVAVLGQADAVLRIPTNDRWCLLEWKLGQTSPEIDLGQACLYHLMLNGDNGSRTDSALAVVSFCPHKSESLFDRMQLAGVQSQLIDLIGRLAGVVGSTPAVKVAPVVVDRVDRGILPIAPPDLLEPPAWVTTASERLLRVLRQRGAACRETKSATIGPAYARFYVFPERGVTSAKVMSQGDEFHLRLGLDAPPNMTVAEGMIGIDLPRPDRQSIRFSDLIPGLPDASPLTGNSKLPIGLDLTGHWHWCDLAGAESCHLLVVGTPGSGKSQWLRTAVASLMMTNTPQTLGLLLIDPKQNAFPFANESPFLIRPIVVPDGEIEVSEILAEVVREMELRYRLFAETRSQSLVDHVRTSGMPMRRIVCVCDEYADLLAASGKGEREALEHQFKRIAAKGRACGIHLILATQQPRANILTTAIRSLLSAKVALRVSDARESRLALEQGGAERLLGNGDLLYKCIGSAIRLQGAWLPSDEEQLVQSPVAIV